MNDSLILWIIIIVQGIGIIILGISINLIWRELGKFLDLFGDVEDVEELNRKIDENDKELIKWKPRKF
jgi:hypothetical protein